MPWAQRCSAVDERRHHGDREEEHERRDGDAVAELEVHFVTSAEVGTSEASWTRTRGRCCVWMVTATFCRRATQKATATRLRPTAMVPMAIVHRGPQASPIQPITGAPTGVPPM